VTFVAAVAGYWALLAFVPVFGKQPGILDPNHNLVAAIDRRLLGSGHLYRETWDPEGILSTLPAIATTLAGVLTGDWLRARRTPGMTSWALAGVGIVAVAASHVMALWMPINKGLWTSSYVVFTAGLALVVFGFFHWLVDGKGIRRPFLPLVVFGVNPIAVYVFSSAVAVLLEQPVIDGENLRDWFCRVTWARLFSSPATSLAYAATYVLLWLAAMTVLYRRKIYIKI
jgi:predicted acyltransferase